MDTEILLYKKMKFGAEFLYPDNPQAHRFAGLLRQETLTRKNVEIISTMGFKVTIHGGPVEVIEDARQPD